MATRNVTVPLGTSARTQAFGQEHRFSTTRPAFQAPRLIGSLCNTCRSYAFPRQTVCPHCGSEDTETVGLSRRGRLETFAIIRQALPGYRGPLPYAVGAIMLPEGVKLRAMVGGCHPEELRTGMEVELDFIKICEDISGNDLVTQAFRPV